jgi:hypothetical protein
LNFYMAKANNLHMAKANVPVSKTGHFPPARLVRRGGRAMQGDHTLATISSFDLWGPLMCHDECICQVLAAGPGSLMRAHAVNNL